jgi:[acyl-carrier-protein] S-malonyltransferase
LRTVVVAPGQGAQKQGMLAPWLDEDNARLLIDQLSTIAGLDLQDLGLNASDETIRATEIAQPLLLTVSLLSWQALLDSSSDLASEVGGFDLVAVAGHSVGEFAAAVVAGSLSIDDAMRLVAARGRAMAGAAQAGPPTGMSAVLGGSPEDVLMTIESHYLVAANINSEGQVVAAGEINNLNALSENPPAGARIRPLPVAGAFHTQFMQSAVAEFARVAADIKFEKPRVTFVSNDGGSMIEDGDSLRHHLVSQISHPVNWLACQRRFEQLKIEQLIELAPSGTLSSIGKRQTPQIVSRPIVR